MTENAQTYRELSCDAVIEALLFVSSEPVTLQQISQALSINTEEVAAALSRLSDLYEGRGIRLQKMANRYALTTAPEAAREIELFLGLEATAKLSRAAIETLTIIAYRQPITRPAIDAIRGVSSDGVLKSLLQKGLVEEQGRAEGPGRPILYGVTVDFLQHFGLSSLDEMPPFEPIEYLEDSNGILKE